MADLVLSFLGGNICPVIKNGRNKGKNKHTLSHKLERWFCSVPITSFPGICLTVAPLMNERVSVSRCLSLSFLPSERRAATVCNLCQRSPQVPGCPGFASKHWQGKWAAATWQTEMEFPFLSWKAGWIAQLLKKLLLFIRGPFYSLDQVSLRLAYL